MKTINKVLTEKEREKYQGADWKEDPLSVLETIDEQLAEHGLEIERVSEGSDEYLFRIIKK